MDAVERIPHPAYSPDLAPSNFFLFPNLKRDIRGCHFRSDEEVVTAVEDSPSYEPHRHMFLCYKLSEFLQNGRRMVSSDTKI